MDNERYTHFCIEGHEFSDASAYLGFDDVQELYDALKSYKGRVKESRKDIHGDAEDPNNVHELLNLIGSVKGSDAVALSFYQNGVLLDALAHYSLEILETGEDIHGNRCDGVQVSDLRALFREMEDYAIAEEDSHDIG